MEDRLFFALILYMIIAVGIISFIPSGYLTSGSYVSQVQIQTAINGVPQNPLNPLEEVSFLGKLMRFMFATWTLNSIPAFFAWIIVMMNYACIIVSCVWVYDKLRGIGS